MALQPLLCSPSLFPSYALYELTADPESLFALPASLENGDIERLGCLRVFYEIVRKSLN